MIAWEHIHNKNKRAAITQEKEKLIRDIVDLINNQLVDPSINNLINNREIRINSKKSKGKNMNNKDSNKKKNGKSIRDNGNIRINKNMKREKDNMIDKEKSSHRDRKGSGSSKKREKNKSAKKEGGIIINIDKNKKKGRRENTINSNIKNVRRMTEENVHKIIDTHTIGQMMVKNIIEHMEVDQMILSMNSFENSKRCLSKKWKKNKKGWKIVILMIFMAIEINHNTGRTGRTINNKTKNKNISLIINSSGINGRIKVLMILMIL